jgi:uncharacterized RDD family membrane protein YckC/predicted Ser/Thr protein kinase
MGTREAQTIDERYEEISSPMRATAYDPDRPAPPPGARESGDPLLGRRIDHFEVRAILGQGGMGTVYLAHDLSLERPVALKILRRDLADNQELVDRLIMEARAQARLQHPNVVTIYYIGLYEGAPYFAMEYVRGKNLHEHIVASGPLKWADALEYIIQTTRALMEAHHRGIVHRDIKPSNLIVTESPSSEVRQIKVADFGLAAPAGFREDHFVGSPYYASPEQMQGHPPDFRSDMYSLGVSFHELVTGAPPFQADSLPDMLALHMRAPRPAIDPRIAPWRLRQLIIEMMDADPTKRPWTYEELLDRLESLRPRPTVAGGMVARGMALAFDLGLALVVAQVIVGAFHTRQSIANEVGLLLFGIYYVLTQRLWGRTLGKRLFGLRLQGTTRAVSTGGLVLRFLVEFWGPIIAIFMVHLHLGATTNLETLKNNVAQLVGVGRIPVLDEATEGLFRNIVVPNLAMLAIPWIGGFFFALFDEQRQALHDRVARTRVVYSIREGSPEAA